MPASDMPVAEVTIGDALVRALLRDQHPDLAELVLGVAISGWDNVNIPLGPELIVRLPRRAIAAALADNEHRWLPSLAPMLPLPIPAPVRVGHAACGFPWSWSICPRLSGLDAASTPPSDPFEAAATLGHFLAALHVAAPVEAPANAHRGMPLGERSSTVRDRVDRLGDDIDARAVTACWARLVETPAWSGPPVWLHGDLHPGNVLVDGGHVSAVIDFGDITAGDPATDLAIAWMLFPAPARAAFRAAAGEVDDHTWARARGWALALGLAFIANSADNPAMDRIGRATLDAVLAW